MLTSPIKLMLCLKHDIAPLSAVLLTALGCSLDACSSDS